MGWVFKNRVFANPGYKISRKKEISILLGAEKEGVKPQDNVLKDKPTIDKPPVEGKQTLHRANMF